ncbi:pantoate--beta-alanine ligase [Salimicrobium halophilum]|uniref:Pantothenate synthetase n=1 Tax=Salimicrobium halophilum TaxID=86666 RepID=A0A1G8WQM1_9BACI|nr:pantoate--beta-alanine ligase [Salimicrobium halophilum]SDJ80672.1 pantoate--beta-alanine ligase [Salimicrobium halophilum]
MKVITTIEGMRAYREEQQDRSVGFVPTMGYLHEGHMSMVESSTKENDRTVVSIFVNPLQFGPDEDFDNYPRNFERDRKIAESYGADAVFYPSTEEMYPRKRTISLNVIDRTDVLCGPSRPGHFEGVATVIVKLLQIIQPGRMYLGQKDAQQVAVLEGLVADFNIPTEIIPCPTVREEDGLAKSSRNVNLTEQERKEAPFLYKSLKQAEKMAEKGERDPEAIKAEITKMIQENTSGTIDYREVLSYPYLKPATPEDEKWICAVAVYFQHARLIDNIILTISQKGESI